MRNMDARNKTRTKRETEFDSIMIDNLEILRIEACRKIKHKALRSSSLESGSEEYGWRLTGMPSFSSSIVVSLFFEGTGIGTDS